MWWLFTIVLSVFVFPQTVHAGASGHPRVIDGDTLAFGDLRVRLDGMDAAELDQTCQLDLRILPCGQMARDALVSLIGGAAVDCQATGTDRYGRMLAICNVQGRDLGRIMVQQGMARVDPRFSQRYLPDQDAAARAGVGLWSMQHEPPATVRHGSAPGGCTIKGNRSANGAIYHLPGQADYDRTRIDPAKGERWFCSETEARAAGWRPARR